MASRIEDILTAILNDGTYTDEPQSRIEAILLAILNETAYTAEAQSRIEAILLCILNGTDLGIVPQSRVETILECIYNGEAYTGDTQSRIEELLKQISEKEPTPPTPTTFTATFVRADGDGGGTLYTQTDIPVGTVPVYGGETPTTTKGSAADYTFKGWAPALAPIQEDTVYTAVFNDNTSKTRKLIQRTITNASSEIVTSIGVYAFRSCTNLATADFPVATNIENNAFRSCTSLTTLILRANQVATLNNTNAFTNASNAIIYVPDTLVDSYKAATNWSTYASRIKGISELPA